MEKNVRVRFAPSPTGALHIGGARTALFNYLFAKKHSGKFILRLEDTDKERSQKIFVDDIKSGLKWLGFKWDEEYKQSERYKIYKKYLQKLKDKNLIYNHDGAVYFKTPIEGKIIVKDIIRGTVEFAADSFDDFVIVKSNGDFTFHFVNVVDDLDMKISHIIRGEDHLSNTPKHILLFQALDAKIPKYVHIPLILNPDRSKMSKRSGDVNFVNYIESGYLPIGLINFLAQLGWSDKNGEEFFTLKELIKAFDLNRVQKAGAVFDVKYLNHINHYYLSKLSPEEYYKLAQPFFVFKGSEKYHKRVLKLLQDRAQFLAQLPELMKYFYQDINYDTKLLVFKKSTPQLTIKGLRIALEVLEAINEKSWTLSQLQQILDETASTESILPGDIFWPIRVSLSGLSGSPSPVELLEVLGKKESIKRIKTSLKKLNG